MKPTAENAMGWTMTRLDKFWAAIIAKTPGFGGDDSVKVTITLESLRELVKRAHNDGFVGGMDVEKANKPDPLGDIFGGLWKGN